MEGKTLVIGAAGQIGLELVRKLRELNGNDNIIATDLRDTDNPILKSGPFEVLDVLNRENLDTLVREYEITTIYNLAALLSATAEKHPSLGWDLNMNGLFNVLDLAKEGKIKKVFWPSSIAVFGPTTPKQNTPQVTVTEPSTVYGISKLAGERWCEYYHDKYGVDVRSIRYPGLIGHRSAPGGGTTDYAVDIFYKAIHDGSFDCFLSKNTYLPMMYMDDAIRATIEITEAPSDQIKIRSSYNLAGISFSPDGITKEIQKHIPQFSTSYNPDFRQDIAATWPASIDEKEAQEDWGWNAEYNLSSMVELMLEEIRKKKADLVTP